MDGDGALSQLPRSYRLALRLRAAGADDELIAECLGIERAAVDPLLTLAAAKLTAAARATAGREPALPPG